jgi:2',3'-cyclic-nucleotide 2'-phosphodiesterase (5'-nucleotidase family)
VADAFMWQTLQSSLNPTIAFTNGGGIRGNTLMYPLATPSAPAGVADTDVFALLPFGNHVGVLGNVSTSDLLSALENAVSRAAPGDPPGLDGDFCKCLDFASVGIPRQRRAAESLMQSWTMRLR